MTIEYKTTDTLIPYANNTHTHSDEQVQQIASSIKEFGFTNPVLLDEKDGVIAGHGRIMAAKLLSLDEVPTITLEGLTEAQVKAYIIADNKLALNAGWDEELLKVEIEGLNNIGFDIDLLGFSAEELDDLDIDLDIDFDADDLELDEDKADDVPELEENPVIKRGDLIELGMNFQHRVMCGDSTSEDDVAELMDGKKADMVFTDPPYGVDFQSNMRTKSDKFDVLKNDDVFLDGWIPLVNKYSKGFVFVWTSWKVVNKWIEICKPIGDMSNMIIWFKGGGGIGDLKKTFSSDYEVALVWHRGADLCGKRIGSVWKINKDGASTYIHPTQKPVELSVEAIDKTTNKKDIVLDLFGGSGSTLIGCEQTDRQCFMMELDPHYCDVIRGRYIQWCKTNSRECSIKLNGMPFDIGTLLNQGINREREL
ncbi:MAG: site-specific DNA-methyltransferase [Candidatus Marinimicrobia bacterium]|nr:site-specific DNA-methyltransferase [Candidatus Neomarinimicrobiota bacterium]